MSIESVFENCTKLLSDEELEQQRDLFMEEIEKQMTRFEKALFTYTFDGASMAVWNILWEEGSSPAETRRGYFAKHKQEYAHKYLEMLCDLYDYKKDA